MRKARKEIHDFLKDENFVSWVRHPDAGADAYWEDWIRKHPDQVKEVKLARELILGFQYQHTFNLPQASYDHMLNMLRAKQHSKVYEEKKEKSWWIRVAASLLLLMLGGMSAWYITQPEEVHDKEPVSLVVKRTQKGEKLTVKLPDGTMVKLNSNSILVFPAAFDTYKRYVKLEGEAFFDVVKDADRPFTIMSDHVQTKVLGTSFNVRAYDDEADLLVAVVSGEVSVKGKESEAVLLSPNEVGYYYKTDSSLSMRQQDVSDLIAWRHNILIFDEDPAEEVWKKLENWYGVHIIVEDRQNIVGRYSGRFYNESLERVLDGISYASEFTYEIQENKNVTIKALPMKQSKAS
ncbi:FecR family protein [Catalinimonas niigatensis]|uniref:FecR family protein n=1 Tax=Catalinimonas niigatensis TaxID=1397264 RepID=UPI0026654BD5|nr:FecR family protein [Catalinimonas niigatensis]WPP50349.1 FecR domain-containing protein [Catalinimonas niigatensis]